MGLNADGVTLHGPELLMCGAGVTVPSTGLSGDDTVTLVDDSCLAWRFAIQLCQNAAATWPTALKAIITVRIMTHLPLLSASRLLWRCNSSALA